MERLELGVEMNVFKGFEVLDFDLRLILFSYDIWSTIKLQLLCGPLVSGTRGLSEGNDLGHWWL